MAKKKRPANKSVDHEHNPLESLPDRRAMEKIMQQLAADYEGERREETPLDRAQEMMYRAFDASPADQVRLARKALTISPDCADAYVLLAEHANTAEEAQELYEQGVAAGERAIGTKGFTEFKGHFWGVLETRPYMRAQQGLAECLWVSGCRDEAAEHYREMLRLNPNDNQGVRYSLATLLLDLDRDEELRRLLKEYEDDVLAEWAYTKALVAFREGGETPQAKKLLKQAVKVNKHVPAYLLGHKPLPYEEPPYISLGGVDEAVSYVSGNRRAWLNTPGAISWVRKTLDMPMPKAPKPRQLSWPELRLVLQRCPQDESEVWQVDALRQPKADDGATEEEEPWVVMIVGRISRRLLGLEVFDTEPKLQDVWNYMTDVMRKPRDKDPCRPVAIIVRRRAFYSAWKAKLKQINVDCFLSDTLDMVDQIQNDFPSIDSAADADEHDAAISIEKILSLPMESGDTWQADYRPMPLWVTGEGVPYRPWMALVVSQTDELILAHETVPERPRAGWLLEAILQAIRRPAAGEPHRPGAIEVNSFEQREALLPYMERVGIECVALERLEDLDSAFDSMTEHFVKQGTPPSIMDAPGMKPEEVGRFYEAAAEYYRRKPWQQVPSDSIIKVECAGFQSGPWYAVVIGQSGVEQGMAIYEDLVWLQRMIDGNASEAEHARGMSAISMMFSEAFDVSTRDIDAAEKYGWSVAGPEAYPLVMRVNPGPAVRAPLVWELELLEGCLRTIPDFLSKKQTSGSQSQELKSGTLTMRLSWLPQ